MQSTRSMQAIRNILAIAATFSMGGGCIALYSFDDFEKKPPVSCKDAKDCPGSDSCGQRVCDKGLCKLVNPVAAGVPIADQPRGDCQRITCDGKGNENIAIDESDVPVDGEKCTDDVCIDGAPSNPNSAIGTQCGTLSSVTCNDAGACVNCSTAADCGVDSTCVTWSCVNSTCVRTLQPIGTVVENPVAGDCQQTTCDVIGEAVVSFAPDDAPSDDNPCTADFCLPTGEIKYEPIAAGISCGDCKVCTAAGTCDACDPITSDCYQNVCIPKPKVCSQASECESGYCIDGFCCNGECASLCNGCSNAKTGQPSGYCAPITGGTDPDGECNNPTVDVCVAGACQCENGIQDGLETGVDCGGSCAPCAGKWDCGSPTACDGDVMPTCCAPLCGQCVNQTDFCKSVQGQTCALGSQQQVITLGTVFNAGCSGSTACKLVFCTCK